MKRLLLATLASVFVFCTLPSMAETKNSQLRQLEKQHKRIVALRWELLPGSDLVDLRGRRTADDARDWVLSEATEDRVLELKKQAKGHDAQLADAAVAELKSLLDENLARVQYVSDYWFKTVPAPFWRRNWGTFATANGLPPEPSDPKVLEIEQRLLAQLTAGDFEQVVKVTAPELNAAFRAMVGNARSTLAKERKSADLKFIPHKNPCSTTTPLKDAPREFYPPGAKRRGEEGTVILRTRINADSCGLATAIVVSTGSPELDEAGLLTAEYTRFKPGTDNGVSIGSEVTYAVKFVFKD